MAGNLANQSSVVALLLCRLLLYTYPEDSALMSVGGDQAEAQRQRQQHISTTVMMWMGE